MKITNLIQTFIRIGFIGCVLATLSFTSCERHSYEQTKMFSKGAHTIHKEDVEKSDTQSSAKPESSEEPKRFIGGE